MKTVALILISFLLLGCTASTYDDIEEIQEENQGELVTYQDVAFIFQNNCTVCHSNPPQNGAPMPLTNYSEVKDAMEDRDLIDRISREEGEQGLMPLGGPRLPQQQIDLITQWNLDGLLEN
ncbi:cytochrome c [Aequorivita viscosa]|nr:cytochrome c [Aequorivita viscosa]